MEYASFWASLKSALGVQIPSILGAVLLLLGGWILAVVAAAAIRRLLATIGFNNRLEPMLGHRFDAETAVSRVAFVFIIAVALVAAFNSLDLEVVSAPFALMIEQVLAYLPQLLAGVLLAVIGWLVATIVRTLLGKLLAKTSLDERLSAEAGMEPVGQNIAQVAYWVVLLLFLPMVLAALSLQGLLGPVQSMVDQVVGFLPNLFAASVIGVVGYFVARIVRGIVVNLMQAARVQSAAQQLGLSEQFDLTRLTGTVVFLLIFVPALISALDALRVEAISGPATSLLEEIVASVPDLIAAALIILVTFYVARFAAALVASLLSGLGLDGVPEKLGIGPLSENIRLSDLIGRLILFFAMLFAAVEAADRLQFGQVRDLVATFITFGADVVLGAVILVVGFWLANLISDAVGRSDRSGSGWLAALVRALIVGLVIAMGLRAMGIADSIVNLAFGLTLGAVAVAFALAFGLGGREAAGKLMEHWVSKLRRD